MTTRSRLGRPDRLLAAGVVSLAVTQPSLADIIRVPEDQPTIQAGIDAAVNGDETVLPGDFNVTFGAYQGGGVADLHTSDDSYVVIGQRAALSVILPLIRLDVEGHAGGDTASEVQVTLEAAATSIPAQPPQRLSLLDYDTAMWEMVDERTATRVDSVVVVDIKTNAQRFVETGTGMLMMRIEWFDPGNVFFPDWGALIDQAIWSVLPDTAVVVADGTWTGPGNKSLDFGGRAITVRSENGAENCIIDCQGSGRAFYFHNGETTDARVSGFTMTNGWIVDGSPGGPRGGAVYITDADPVFTGCTFTDNDVAASCGGYGGAIYSTGGSPTFLDCTFDRNGAGSDSCAGQGSASGGAIYAGAITLSDCVFTANGASGNVVGSGGGASLRGNATLTNCVFDGNRVYAGMYGGAYGGGVSASEATTLINCLVIDNALLSGGQYSGGGISGSPVLINCTIADNHGGSGLSSDPLVSNSVVWGNTPDQISGSPTISYSCIEDGYPGTGNIDDDPQFVDPLNGDHRLSPGSPCIDAADNLAVLPEITTDLDGNPRFVDDPNTPDTGNGNPPIVDMGPYELQGTTTSGTICPEDSDGSFKQSGGRENTTHATGGTKSGRPRGWQEVARTRWTTPLKRIEVHPLLMTALMAGTFAADMGRADVIHEPGDQSTIQPGIDAAADGHDVVVADGTWTGDGNRDPDSLGEDVTVRSENGSQTTLAGSCTHPLFISMKYGVGDAPISVAIGDLDGVNGPDLAVANSYFPSSDNVSVLLNQGDGTYAAAVAYTTGDDPYSVAIGDLDGINGPDLAVVNRISDDVSVLLNQGDGTFAAAVAYDVIYQPRSVAIDDLDGINGPDLAVAIRGRVLVLLNRGDGTFAAAVVYHAGDELYSVAIGDLDGINGPDLAVASYDTDDVSVLLNEGDGTFAAAVAYAAGNEPFCVAIGDLDGINGADLAVANRYSDDVSVLLNQGEGTFAAAVAYAAGDEPYSVAIGDLDGINGPDLAVANRYGDDVSVLLNQGDGNFATAVAYTAGDGPWSVAIGDLNGINGPDLAVANLDSDNVSLLLNQGDGTFAATVAYGAGDRPWSVAIGDLDRVNGPDLAVANYDSDDVSVLLNQGDGTFAAAVAYAVIYQPRSVAIGELDAINGPDLAVANAGSDDVSVLLNQGDGTFAATVAYTAGDEPCSVAIGDLDGINGPDLAVASRWSEDVSVLLNQGHGTFAAAVAYGAGDRPQSVAIGDIDRVNGPDLAVANSDSDDVSVLLNQGDGTFAGTVAYGTGDEPYSVAIGDLDGINGPDLAVANATSDNVSVLLNQGDGTFATAMTYTAGDQPHSVAIGDLDRVNGPDLALANARSNDVSVLLNRGDGTFAGAKYAAGDRPWSVAIGDLQRVNGPDLAVANYDSNDVSVLLNLCPASVLPVAFSIPLGRFVSGALADLYDSDDSYVAIEQRAALSVLLPVMRMEIEGTSPIESATTLMFILEAAATAVPANVPQRIELFNHDANSWEIVDERTATLTDSVAEVVIDTDPDRFIRPGTNELRSRVDWFDPGAVFFTAWGSATDQAIWSVLP